MFRKSILIRRGPVLSGTRTDMFTSPQQPKKASLLSGPSSSSVASTSRASSQSVLDTFLQIQLGTWSPTPQTARQVLATHFGAKLVQMQLSEAKLAAMDPKRVTKLLKQTLYEQYLAVPFTVLSFDLEFTGIPSFSGDVSSTGPSEDIVEIALYDPDRKKLFEQLVLPYNKHNMSDIASNLTGLNDNALKTKGKPLIEAWNAAVDFIEETMKYNISQRTDQIAAETDVLSHQRASMANPFNFDSAEMEYRQQMERERLTNPDFIETTAEGFKSNQPERLLLLSHGARLVDIAMINWVQTLEGAKQLPATTTFGDTLLQVKDLHRRRPVTKDKWPAAWSLEDIAAFLNLKVETTHRAGPDAVLTWEALYHSLDRYGDESLTPRQQLVGRFFDQEAKSVLGAYDMEQQHHQRHRRSAASSSSSTSQMARSIGGAM